VLAVVLASVIDREDSQYSALLVVPIVEAAFRFGLAPALAVATAADSITFYWVWRYANLHPPFKVGEYFEAGTQAIIFMIVAVLVSVLVRRLRNKQSQLAGNLRELEITRENLLQEEKLAAVGRLSSAVAHEIRNPVAMISSSLATAKTMAGAEREEMLEIAGKEALRLVSLTNDLLAYARPRRPAPEQGDVCDTVAYVADACRASARERSISLRVDVPHPVIVDYDHALLEQALMNLVMNAVDASPPGGEVSLAVVTITDQVRIDVDNHGGPIPPDVVTRLFEPFFTTKRAGSGLGLATAYNAARIQGGDLILADNAKTIRFSLLLPRYQLAARG